MASLAYLLCVLTALGAAVLLSRAYLATRAGLLGWSAACFWGLSLANALTLVDLYVFPDRDYYSVRLLVTTGSTALLVFGLIWDSR
jgi:hypothetical protein